MTNGVITIDPTVKSLTLALRCSWLANHRPIRATVRAVQPAVQELLLLAGLGLYGVTSYSVAQRNQEIGVRMALGAPAGRVRRGVTAEVLRLGLVGVAVGYLAALAATRLLSGLLFGVGPTDGVTFVVAGLVFLGVAWLGGYLPARRASAVDPIIALRAD